MGMLSMTRGERRGIIALLAVLAFVVATFAIRRCGGDDAGMAVDGENTVLRDSLMALPDTSSVIKKKYRNDRKKMPVVSKPVPERSPLDEVL